MDESAWLAGAYVYEAFSAVMANAFSKHGNHKYRSKPFSQEIEDEKRFTGKSTERPLTEEEKKRYTDQLFLALSIMQANFNINKQIEAEKN